MVNQRESKYRLLFLVRWAARVLSVFSVGIILLFIIGEGFSPLKIKPTEWLGFIFFPLGISLGMIVAWWKEGLGGSITVGSLCIFYLMNFILSGSLPKGWAFLVFAFPGLLFLIYWYILNDENK
jgi:hypothetical protein